jgi:hypothetical protein
VINAKPYSAARALFVAGAECLVILAADPQHPSGCCGAVGTRLRLAILRRPSDNQLLVGHITTSSSHRATTRNNIVRLGVSFRMLAVAARCALPPPPLRVCECEHRQPVLKTPADMHNKQLVLSFVLC